MANNISRKCVPKRPVNNIPALVQIMAWCWPGGKALSEQLMVSLLAHISVTQPQLVDKIMYVVIQQRRYMYFFNEIDSFNNNISKLCNKRYTVYYLILFLIFHIVWYSNAIYDAKVVKFQKCFFPFKTAFDRHDNLTVETAVRMTTMLHEKAIPRLWPRT